MLGESTVRPLLNSLWLNTAPSSSCPGVTRASPSARTIAIGSLLAVAWVTGPSSESTKATRKNYRIGWCVRRMKSDGGDSGAAAYFLDSRDD